MAKPFSLDQRERVVGAVERGGLSRRRAAARFGVGAIGRILDTVASSERSDYFSNSGYEPN